LLIHEAALKVVWPSLVKSLTELEIILKCDFECKQHLPSDLSKEQHVFIQDSKEEDYTTEFLNLTLAVKVVPSVQEAIQHINTYGSHHTDSIVTETPLSARLFTKMVDSAGVYVNASTRFADGFRYGFGTEVGVSTNKTHARGPVGLQGLMIYKYLIKSEGDTGHVTTDYGSADGKKRFKHQLITKLEEPPF